jgi:glycosyltransferase involved in cell wall biosynthesis
MRFCLVSTFYPPYGFGGDAIYVQRLARALVARGHHVEVIHSLDSFRALSGKAATRALPPPLTPELEADGVIVHRLSSRVGVVSPLTTAMTGRPLFERHRISRLLRQGRFDVVHFHNISLVGGPALLRLGQGIKLYTMHEHWLLCPTHVLFRFNRELCRRRTCVRCQLVQRRPLQLWRGGDLLPRSLLHVDAFLALTRFTRELHQARFPALPWTHLPPFATPASSQLDQAAVGLLPERPFFLYVGRLEKLKGVHTLVPLFQRQGAGAPPADLVIVGGGSLEPALKEQRLHGGVRIHVLGPLPSTHLPAIYARAIAVLVPSLTYELFNQVILEAFAVGTPVIARRLGPLPEIIAESGGGLTYSDDAELLTHMNQLAHDPADRQAHGRRGQRAVETIWSERRVIDRYLEIIEGLQAAARGMAGGTADG